MSSIAGTVIAAKITTGDTANTYPVAEANDLLGGHHTVATLAERDAIPAERRAEGMTCHVAATGLTYSLVGGAANTDWSTGNPHGSTSADISATFPHALYETLTTYQHPRGIAELTGTMTFQNAYSVYGLYEQMATTVQVSKILANVWCYDTNKNVTAKLFVRSDATAFNPDSVTPDANIVISSGNMPHASNVQGSLFDFGATITVPAGYYLFVIWQTAIAGGLSITCTRVGNTLTPPRHSFVLGDNNQTFIKTDTTENTGFFAPTFTAYGDISISTSVVYSSGPELCVNGGFETLGAGGSDVFANWIEQAGTGPVVADTTIKHSGSRSLRLDYSAGDAWYVPQINNILAPITVEAGQTYYVSFWTRGDGVADGKWAAYDSTHYAYIGAASRATGISGTTWTQIAIEIVIPSGCTRFALIFYPTGSAGQSVWYDDVSVTLKVASSVNNTLTLQQIFNLLDSRSLNFFDPNKIMLSTTVRDAIVEAYNRSAPVATTYPRIILPDEIVAVVGDTLQLFHGGYIERPAHGDDMPVVTCAIGASYPRYFEVTPVAGDAGTKTYRIDLQDVTCTTLNTKTINILVKNPTGQPTTNKNVLCIGDSLTAGGEWVTEFRRRLCGSGGTPTALGYSNITLLGTCGSGVNLYEGHGGWTYNNYLGIGLTAYWITTTHDKDATDQKSYYVDANSHWWQIETIEANRIKMLPYNHLSAMPASGTLTWISGGTHHNSIVFSAASPEPGTPFWNPNTSAVDFAYYCTQHGYSGIDIAYILLGWNGLAGGNKYLASDHAATIAQAKTFISTIRASYPSAIIGILGLQVPSPTGGLAANYGANLFYANYYQLLRTINGYNLALQDLANDASYTAFTKYLAVAPQFDSEFNMPWSNTAVNSRSATTERRGTNGVHPSTDGYYQIADVAFRDFIRSFCS